MEYLFPIICFSGAILYTEDNSEELNTEGLIRDQVNYYTFSALLAQFCSFFFVVFMRASLPRTIKTYVS